MGLIGCAIVGLLFLWPVSKILMRAGYSPWYCLLGVVPIVNLVALWMFATADWPAMKRSPS
jgi:hypothetical protein